MSDEDEAVPRVLDQLHLLHHLETVTRAATTRAGDDDALREAHEEWASALGSLRESIERELERGPAAAAKLLLSDDQQNRIADLTRLEIGLIEAMAANAGDDEAARFELASLRQERRQLMGLDHPQAPAGHGEQAPAVPLPGAAGGGTQPPTRGRAAPPGPVQPPRPEGVAPGGGRVESAAGADNRPGARELTERHTAQQGQEPQRLGQRRSKRAAEDSADGQQGPSAKRPRTTSGRQGDPPQTRPSGAARQSGGSEHPSVDLHGGTNPAVGRVGETSAVAGGRTARPSNRPQQPTTSRQASDLAIGAAGGAGHASAGRWVAPPGGFGPLAGGFGSARTDVLLTALRDTQGGVDDSWVGEVNNGAGQRLQWGHIPVDPSRGRNCGLTTLAVFDRLSGRSGFRVAPGRAQVMDAAELAAALGMVRAWMSSDHIAALLRAQQPGTHTVVAAVFTDSQHQRVAHSFNVVYDGTTVFAIDGQTGTATRWLPQRTLPGIPADAEFQIFAPRHHIAPQHQIPDTDTPPLRGTPSTDEASQQIEKMRRQRKSDSATPARVWLSDNTVSGASNARLPGLPVAGILQPHANSPVAPAPEGTSTGMHSDHMTVPPNLTTTTPSVQP